MAVGSLGAWKLIADSAAQARVVTCGVDPSRINQQSLSCNSDYPSGSWLSISTSGDAALRCQAATWTAARETAEVEMRSLEDSRAVLLGSFEMASASGFEECDAVSQQEEQFLGFAMAEPISAAQPQRLYHGRRGGGDGYAGLETTAKLVTPTLSKSEILLASFEVALKEAGRNAEMVASLAVRAWRNLGDANRAEALFLEALELAPQDSPIHASYAEFLWQCDV